MSQIWPNRVLTGIGEPLVIVSMDHLPCLEASNDGHKQNDIKVILICGN